jgi:hypothetical protein
VLALALNPDAIAPELDPSDATEVAEVSAEEGAPTPEAFPSFYAIPAPFGQLTGITLVVGVADDEGARTSVQLQTPAANSFVYNDFSC